MDEQLSAPLCPVFPDAYSFYFFKYTAEVINITDPAREPYFFSGFISKSQHILGVGNSDTQQIVHNAHTKLFFENSG